ncbi:SseB family protein [Streptomyces sp. NRRL B-1677]|uniref:SseB family protein n=1 Tax=Streptomyces klenkii TaxID=1420899 RepID=A0A3B0AYN6_9ACTN|nr:MULTISPECIES: SseB family protein [Streptomyces]MBF6048677.1 SseB family protein [Streptomyces sp. NRRL B-1677]RKN65530.1 SseB family protein [Streptomyces klenkii]
MALKNIPDPGFSDDDGSADAELTAALAAWSADPGGGAESRVLAALRGARLLVPVVAVLGEVETGPDGLKREKTSDMAVPTLQAPDGRKALPAFTSTGSLARWRADARPVAVPLHQALQAAAHEKADTIVLDMAGPVPYQLTGPALLALAEGRESTDPLTDPAVADALRAVLTAEPAVRRAHLAPSREADGTLALALAAEPGAPETTAAVHRIAEALASDEVLRARLVRGLDLALLPAGASVPGEPLFTR